jgi:4-hydroxy-3-polyprenylbenzoate decarboxylase
MMKKRLIVGLSGASGIIYGIRLLEVLCHVEEIETHLIISSAAKRTALLETDYTIDQIQSLANKVYGFNDIAASISSGSYKTMGMVIIPCAI